MRVATSAIPTTPLVSTPTNTSTGAATNAAAWRWSSPVPYLFLGLALMLGLISLALLVLACLHRKSESSPSTEDAGKLADTVDLPSAEREPKIVVIMAGDERPTYLAKPVSSIDHQRHVEQQM